VLGLFKYFVITYRIPVIIAAKNNPIYEARALKDYLLTFEYWTSKYQNL